MLSCYIARLLHGPFQQRRCSMSRYNRPRYLSRHQHVGFLFFFFLFCTFRGLQSQSNNSIERKTVDNRDKKSRRDAGSWFIFYSNSSGILSCARCMKGISRVLRIQMFPVQINSLEDCHGVTSAKYTIHSISISRSVLIRAVRLVYRLYGEVR